MIRTLKEKIKEGTKFFVGHGTTNDHSNREPVGEVVGSLLKEIGGRLSNIIVGWFPEKEKVSNMDVCSMEADVHTSEDNMVGDINDVTGIALGSSDSENPAFPGALRLSTVQCFGEEKNEKTRSEKVTFEEVKAAIREMNIHPWQLFTEDDIKNDRTFSKVFAELETLKIDNTELKKTNEKLESDSQESVRQLEIKNSDGKLKELMGEDLTDRQKKFITSKFTPDKIDDLSDDGLKKFIENTKKEYAETARLFGEEESSSNENNENNETKKKESSSDTVEEEAEKLMGVTNG